MMDHRGCGVLVLKTRQQIPPLTARTPTGHTVRAWDYKQKKNLVIAFLHAGCRRCEDFLNKLSTRAAELAEREAVALVVFAEAPQAMLSENLPAQVLLAADMSGRSQRAYLGEDAFGRSEEHTSELQSQSNLVCRLLLEKKNTTSRPVCCCALWS